MDDKKRMVDTYEVKHAVCIGDKEILFMEDGKKPYPYLVCNCTWDNPLGVNQYSDAVVSADYLEMMAEFASRVTAQIEAVKAERAKISVSLGPFTLEHCVPDDTGESIQDKVAVIRQECLRPEYRTADKQLVLVTGGFGSQGKARGRAVYVVNLYSSKESRWNRGDILGVVKPECMPDWVKERLQQIESERQVKHRKQEQVR
ncbi:MULTISPECIES: hypothetical protein [Dehalobacter]|jgi:hypothetical protein|uniref:Uncharacterized protein n=2 Tax=Dehalobacter restrictus TaxID=55583 RepID=A0A857DE63_9FIRM|nr:MULTISPECIES: hypothetical protein [Dehalobacter]AHF09015.1 hypothetical protein DEHRE_01920 [Dehalobacter restrictus DSM 9455]MCG1024983.1 hypothetical protein [Dehalobacter sp.]QGZ99539.1 hypothetical protein GQ588_02165 [Dehalobacter restrictus]